MASSSGKKTSSSGKNSKNNSRKRNNQAHQAAQDSALFHEIGLIVLFVVMVLLFLCNFGLIGPVGDVVSSVLFGMFGFTAYIVPVLVFIGIAFWFANEGNPTALRKMIAGVVLFLMIGIICDLISGSAASLKAYDIKALYADSSEGKRGGGIIAGSLSFLMLQWLELVGTILVVLLCVLISGILLTERSLIGQVKKSSNRLKERSRVDAERRREYMEQRRQEQEEQRAKREEERSRREEQRQLQEEAEREKRPRVEKKVSGVMLDTSLKKQPAVKRRDDIHEIMYNGDKDEAELSHLTGNMQHTVSGSEPLERQENWDNRIRIHRAGVEETVEDDVLSEVSASDDMETPEVTAAPGAGMRVHRLQPEGSAATHHAAANNEENILSASQGANVHSQSAVTHSAMMGGASAAANASNANITIPQELPKTEKKPPAKYMFPPLSRLQKGAAAAGDSSRELKETALRLQQTLNTFGVKVTITDISQGPSVTRYELQPEQGVKVSKIVNLADDIKLNLAATDIRIEAPIPGKAAIGIEVPNKENMTVALRDLLESKEFKDFPSNIAFAVGKDIGGKTVVTDIGKMPHMLIAGATGSGKSVCINTLIMSILYKAHPDDVKLIMVDPKVVELSVYNGIPHLLIPVVTDPKKAAAALHWGVSEMEDRYRKFADYNVRDLKGYNKKVESLRENGDENAPTKMPQIVIIVDELADLMMVCPGEVEESICRLAQLARAAGIHLIIATQRPSVDVITGLIKANMPSRVAFSVSSGVDSRTILDMNGAEKLLGKGDMLFYPQGYSKPARIQGAFVSDKEVSDVVDFLKNQILGNTYAEDIEEKIKNIGVSGGGASGGASGGNERDEYFAEAGRFIIEKDKASIGMLQRVLKIGFNRAARIMDQLCEYGVVGEEEGTKPRKVLMSEEQFEQLLEEI